MLPVSTENEAISVSGTPSDNFTTFFKERDKSKKDLYTTVVNYGFLTMIVGAMFIIVATVMLNSDGLAVRLPGSLIAVCGGVCLSAGLCVASTVPAAEFDIDEELNARDYLRVGMSLFIGLIGTVGGGLFSLYFPYFPSVPLLLAGVWCTLHEVTRGFDGGWPLTLKFASIFFFVNISALHVFLFFTWFPSFVVASPNTMFLNTAVFILSWREEYNKVWTALAALVFLAMLCTLWYIRTLVVPIGGEKKKGWKTSVLYATAYQCLFFNGATYILNGLVLPSLTTGIPADIVWSYIFNIVLSLIPPLLLLVLGPSKVFSLMARYFEYDIVKLQEGGAKLAFLVSHASSATKTGANVDVWWVIRANQDKTLKRPETDNCIDRSLWMRGELQPKTTSATTPSWVKITMSCNKNPHWKAWYEKDELKDFRDIPGMRAYEAEEALHDQDSLDQIFAAWIVHNFGPKQKAVLETHHDMLPYLKSKSSKQDSDIVVQPFDQKSSLKDWAKAVFNGNIQLCDGSERGVLIELPLTAKMGEKEMEKWAKDNDNFSESARSCT